MLPLLNPTYLEDEQVIYECQLRHLQFHPLTNETRELLGKKISDYVGDPAQLVYVDTPENKEKDLVRCITGLKMIVVNSGLSLMQRLHRTLHYYYRLRRLTELNNKERQTRYEGRAMTMITTFQSGHPRDPVPIEWLSWAKGPAITNCTGTIPKRTPLVNTRINNTQPINQSSVPPTHNEPNHGPNPNPALNSSNHVPESNNNAQSMNDFRPADNSTMHGNRPGPTGMNEGVLNGIVNQLINMQRQQHQQWNDLRAEMADLRRTTETPNPAQSTTRNSNPIINSPRGRPNTTNPFFDFEENVDMNTNRPSQPSRPVPLVSFAEPMNEQRSHFQPHQDPTNVNESVRETSLMSKLQHLPRWQCKFSGSKYDDKHQTLDDYIASIRNFMTTVGMTSRDMMRHIFPTLRDGAQRFYLSMDVTDMELEEFFSKLRDRFGDKRGAAAAMMELSRVKFDERRSIHEHIDDLIFRMNMLNYDWGDSEQLAIIRQTLPEAYLKPIMYARVKSVDELKDFCREVFPVSSNNRRRSDKVESKRVMTVETQAEDDNSGSECEDDPFEKICSVVRKLERNSKRPDKFRSSNQTFKKSVQPVKQNHDESKPKTQVNLFCANCLTVGHAATSCSEPKRIYCYNCGALGATVNTCTSDICQSTKNE